MNHYIFAVNLFFLVVFFTISNLSFSIAETIDGRVASVDGRWILLSDVRPEFYQVKKKYKKIGAEKERLTYFLKNNLIKKIPAKYRAFKMPNRNVMVKEALTNIINRTILLIKAGSDGITVSKEELLQELEKDSVLRKRRLSGTKTLAFYKNAHIEKIRYRIILYKYINQVLNTRLMINESEKKKYYEKNNEKFISPPDVKICHIFFHKKKSGRPVRKLLKKIVAIKKQILDYNTFIKMAVKYNEDLFTKDKKGKLGFVGNLYGRNFLNKLVVIKKKGLAGKIQESRKGYHLVWILEIKPSGLYTYAEVQNKIQRMFFHRKFRSWLAKIKSKMVVKTNYRLLGIQ